MSNKTNDKLSEYANQLNQLQGDIQANETLSVNHGKVALALAVKAGGILNDAKELVKYGEWENWLAANVKGITDRTAQNYMKLAKRVSVLEGCESLGEAYRAVGIKKRAHTKKEPGEDGHGSHGTQKDTPGDKDAAHYTKLNEAQALIAKRVRNEIQNAGVNWDVATWTVARGKPTSADSTNQLALVIHKLTHYVAFRDYTSLSVEDETRLKIKAVLNELLSTVTAACRESQPQAQENVSTCYFNADPVEVAEKEAA